MDGPVDDLVENNLTGSPSTIGNEEEANTYADVQVKEEPEKLYDEEPKDPMQDELGDQEPANMNNEDVGGQNKEDQATPTEHGEEAGVKQQDATVPDDKKWPGWPGESVFRILVPTTKVGAVTGREGDFIKKMCEESRARIKVLEGPPAVPERAVMISAKDEPDAVLPPAVDGLLRVHKRITDGLDGETDQPERATVTAGPTRLLVPASQADSLIGKQEATIKSIQDASKCVLRIVENVPPVALNDDRVVEIQGEPLDAHKAVELIASHLRKFLVDCSVLPLFETQMKAQGSSHLTRRVRRVRKLVEPTRIRLGSWNVGSLTGKLRELVDTAVRRRVNILCVQDTKWKGKKAKEVDNTGFKLWYTGTTSNRNGVGVLIDKSLKDGVVEVRRQGDRIILVKLVISDMVLNVISAYAPQVGHEESAKRQFWEDLDGLLRAVPSSEKLFIGGHLNGHVGTTRAGFEAAHGGFGYGSRNQEGEEVLNFATALDLMIANTFFRKRQSHLVTFSSGQHSSQIDFVLTRRRDKRTCLDCKVLPGECVVSQHKLMVADFRFLLQARGVKQPRIARTKWWKLEGETSKIFKERERVIEEGPWKDESDANSMWEKMATCVWKVASEVPGVTKGSGCDLKDTSWWNEDVQKAPMKAHNMHIEQPMPRPQPWGPPPPSPWGHPPPISPGGLSYVGNPQYMPPWPQESYYPPDVPPVDKEPHYGISSYGRDLPLSAPSGNQNQAHGSSQVTHSMQVPLSYADAVIGAAGASISYIRRHSGATISIQEGAPGEMTVEITGSASQVQTAQQLIKGPPAPAPPAQPVDTGYSSYPPYGGASYGSPPGAPAPAPHNGGSYGAAPYPPNYGY